MERATFPAPVCRGALRMTVQGHLDGIAVCCADTGEVLGVFGGIIAAGVARRAAHEALGQLAACLASAPSRRAAL